MSKPTIPTGERGVSYIRVSRNQQETARQRDGIRLWLDRLGLPLTHTFEDTGSRDLAAKRPEFQRLLKAVEAGLVDWIVVDSQDRFGTKDAHEWGKFLCRAGADRCRAMRAPATPPGRIRDSTDGIYHVRRAGWACDCDCAKIRNIEAGAIEPSRDSHHPQPAVVNVTARRFPSITSRNGFAMIVRNPGSGSLGASSAPSSKTDIPGASSSDRTC